MTNEQRLDRLERIAKLFVSAGRAERRNRKQLDEKIDILINFQIENEQRFAKNEERFAKNEERFAKVAETVNQIVQAQKRSDERIDALAEAQTRTEHRLESFIAAVQRDRSNSH